MAVKNHVDFNTSYSYYYFWAYYSAEIFCCSDSYMLN